MKIKLLAAMVMLPAVISCSDTNAEWAEDPANDKIVHVCGRIENTSASDVRIGLTGVTDMVHGGTSYTIPVKNGCFSADVPLNSGNVYELDVPLNRHYSVARFAIFFADQDTVRLLFDAAGHNYTLDTDGENQAYQQYRATCTERFALENKALSEEYESIGEHWTDAYHQLSLKLNDKHFPVSARDSMKLIQSQMCADSSAYTPAYRAYLTKNNRLERSKLDFTRTYLEERKPSLALFEILYESIQKASGIDYNYPEWALFYDREYSNKFAGSRLHQAVESIRNAHQIQEGTSFIDFTLPDKDGVPQTLSTLIDGKYALLQFWATWCSPCITKRETVRPLYEQYKDRGFTVVEVAREFKSDADWRAFLKKDGADWTDLLAMEKDHSVWIEYGLGPASGGLFLIAPDGTIIKIDPSKEDIQALCESMR